MKLQVIRAHEISSEHAARWAQWQAADPALASPYFHPEFTRSIAAAREDVFVGIVDDGEAFFPFQHGRWGIGRPVGGPLSDYHGVIARPGLEWEARALIRSCGLRVWDFDHGLAAQTALAPWCTLRTESPVIDLAQAVAVGSAKLSTDAANRRRKLEREVGPLEFEMFSTDDAVLERLCAWKSAQYAATGGLDLFAVPWVRRAIGTIQAQTGENFAGVLSVLRAGGRPVAVHFGMRARHVLHYWFPAYDAELSGYSPGILLLLAVIAAAPAHGLSLIDLGKGEAFYKKRLANGAVPLGEGSVVAAPWIAACRQGRVRMEEWVRRGPFIEPARKLGRWVREIERARKFR